MNQVTNLEENFNFKATSSVVCNGQEMWDDGSG